jgi:general secretion pathway protein F
VPIFEYRAFASGGAARTGVIDADTPREARARLRRDNLLVSDLVELRDGARRGGRSVRTPSARLLERLQHLRSGHSGPGGRDLEVVAAITRQMGTLLGAGIPLAEALRAIIEQAETRRIETMFRTLRERITQGASLGDALAEHPRYFSELYVNMVKAGEATGKVDQVLRRLADFLHRQRALQRKVVAALTYPIMMILLGIVVVGILMTVVVPKITAMLQEMGKTIPVPTQVLITVSNGFKNYWWLGCLVIAAVSFAIERYYKTRNGRLVLDRVQLRLPVLGDVLRKAAVARFSRTLSTLLGSGVPAVQSLEITRNVVNNEVLARATDHIRDKILEGTDIATPLKAVGVFPPVVGYMVAVGEKSGELEQMLDRIADAYDEEIEVATERATTILEPVMIVVLAVVVGFIVYSIILPILQSTSVR